MNRHLLSVLDYFGYFSYAPSFDEIYTFFPRKISKKGLKSLLIRSQYTLPQYSTPWGEKPILAIRTYINILKVCPLVRFIGVTGASAMVGFHANDDLDLCIVAKHNVLWTTRFFAVILAKMLGMHNKTGVCLNLFFDESDLVIPKKKQNSYIAHELLQMRPIIDKDSVYQQFLDKNKWIYRFFPNARCVIPTKVGIQENVNYIDPVSEHGMTQRIDRLFKSIQLPIIRRNHTAFFITQTQLWLFKSDFEKKLKRRGLVI